MPYRKEQYPPPAETAAKGILSRDGIEIAEMVKQIAFSSASKEDRSEALLRVAQYHCGINHVMVGILSTLLNIDPPAARQVAHAVLAEKLNQDNDLVYAAAARVLVETIPQSERDITLVSRCLCSRSDAVYGATLRALHNLHPLVAGIVYEKAKALEQTPNVLRLAQALHSLQLSRHSLPPRPVKTAEVEKVDTPAVESREVQKTRRPPRKPAPPKVSIRRAPAPEVSVGEPRQALPEPPKPQQNTRRTSPSLTAEQRCLLLPHISPDVKALSSAELAATTRREKAPEKLLTLLCEITLRNGREVLSTHMSQLVWLTSTPFGEGNRDVRTLTEILFAE